MPFQNVSFEHTLRIGTRTTLVRVHASVEYALSGNRVLDYSADYGVDAFPKDEAYVTAMWPELKPIIEEKIRTRIRDYFSSSGLAYS